MHSAQQQMAKRDESKQKRRRANRLSFPKHPNTQIIEDVFFIGVFPF
jgi:hypothetical protein